MKALLAASLSANIAVALYALSPWPATGGPIPATVTSTDFCNAVATDLDFLIDGLKRRQDPFYTPLVVRTLQHAIVYCRPAVRTDVEATMAALRQRLAYLVAENVTDAQREQAHVDVVRGFAKLRKLYHQ